MRDAFGKKLAELGAVYKNLVVLDADVSSSTKSSYFAQAFPDRFFNCGVMEGNMAGMAAGFASAGFIPVVNAFAVFLALKSVDQIRNDFCYNVLPVVLAGAYSGLSDSFDGASHHSIEDIAIMRALPNMEVIVPGDNRQAEMALEYALSQKKPVFIRLNRNETADIPATEGFDLRKPILLKEGTELTIAATGLCARIALDAAMELEKEGIRAAVYSVPLVKPLDVSGLENSVRKTGGLLTMEEHNILGGFGSACLEQLAPRGIKFWHCPIGINDVFTETGPYSELLALYGLNVESILPVIRRRLNKE
jgi:transketolase